MPLSQAEIIAFGKAQAAKAAQASVEQPVLPTGIRAQTAAAKSAKASTAKRLGVAGAVGAVGFFLGGPIGAALGAAAGYGFMYVKEHGLGLSK